MSLKHLMYADMIGPIGFGCVLLGIGFAIIDYFVVKELDKKYVNLKPIWNDAAYLQALDVHLRNQTERARRIYYELSSHKLRRFGITLFLIGGLLVVFRLAAGGG